MRLLNSKYRRSREKRYGMTLVELMVVATVASAMLSIVVCFLVGLQRWDRRVRETAVENEQAFRLGNSLRADIRQGIGVALIGPDTLAIEGPEKLQTNYVIERSGCRRTVKQAGEAEARSAELFAIGKGNTWKLDAEPAGQFTLIIASLEDLGAGESTSNGLPVVVCASVGADALDATPTKQAALSKSAP